MFSVRQKREIAEKIQRILRETNHPELPINKDIQFRLYVSGAELWSWANIQNNAAVKKPDVSIHNESQDLR